MQKFDAIIIGTGQAGPSLANRLCDEGMKVVIIERNRFGGTCVNNGCIPTKTMVASARAVFMARRASDFGVDIESGIKINMKKVKERKDQVVARSNTGIYEWLTSKKNLTVIKGHARFKSPHLVRVNNEDLQADKIFINVGTRAFIPLLEELDKVDYLTNSGMMDVDFVPDHLVIIGGSYIGLEFGQMFRRFGSRVTIIEKSHRLIYRDDEDVSSEVQRILQNEGIEFRLNSECINVGKQDGKVVVKLNCSAGSDEVVGSHLLLAVGRTPNTHDLGLEKAGIAVDKRGYILVDDHLNTNVPGIWALGDCNGKGAFTHTSYNDYEIVAANLLENGSRRVSDRILTYALYIDPPLGRVGMTEKQVRESGKKAKIAKYSMARVGRAVEKGETHGFMKIIIDAQSEKILGAAILGVGGDEIVHLITDVMYAKKPYTLIKNAVHIHPTVSELIPTMLGTLEDL